MTCETETLSPVFPRPSVFEGIFATPAVYSFRLRGLGCFMMKHTYMTHTAKRPKRIPSPERRKYVICSSASITLEKAAKPGVPENKKPKTTALKSTTLLFCARTALNGLIRNGFFRDRLVWDRLAWDKLAQFCSQAGFAQSECFSGLTQFLRGTLSRGQDASHSSWFLFIYLLRVCVLIGYILTLIITFNGESKACPGRFVNPLSDICWSCLFPLSIGPATVSNGGRSDTPNPSQIPCFCPKPPLPTPVPGIPVGFWEPVRLVDVTRIPYCMVSMGGLELGRSLVGYGVHGANGERRTQHSFYQVHWYIYPVIYWLELLVDFVCLERGQFDVGYITELDPLWNDDKMSFIINPEAVLFGNPLAQAACAADCAAAAANLPLDTLFWCNGCQGSLYPFTGNNPAHNGGVQSSLLMVGRIMAKFHRELLLWVTSGREALCEKQVAPLIKKSQYRTQMTYPRALTRGPLACPPLGRTETVWGVGREFPYKGEDFGYLIWRKKNCCIL